MHYSRWYISNEKNETRTIKRGVVVMFKEPNYKLLKYELDNSTQRLNLYIQMIWRYKNSNQLKHLFTWFEEMTLEELDGILLRMVGNSRKLCVVTTWRGDHNLRLIFKIKDLNRISYLYSICSELTFNFRRPD